jgi:hypothetical protein
MNAQSTADVADAPRRSAIEEVESLIEGYGHEARKMQRLGWLASLAIVLASALVPVSIVISTETGAFVFGKLLPSLLAALAALAAGSAQIVRPYDRWRLFNTQKYALEAERLSYVHRIGDYQTGDADRTLMMRVAAAVRTVTEEWRAAVVPQGTGEAIKQAGGGTPAA